MDFKIIEEGIYEESWVLHHGFFLGPHQEARSKIVVAGDGPISWTAISDLLFGTAKIITAPSEEWAGRTLFLSQREAQTLRDVTRTSSDAKVRDISLEIVSKKVYKESYQSTSMFAQEAECWSSVYETSGEGKCCITDDPMGMILEAAGRKSKMLEETIFELFK